MPTETLGIMTIPIGLPLALNASREIVYRPTSAGLVPSVVGGLIGGGTVLVGVLFAEYLARRRDRAQRFLDELWNLVDVGSGIFADDQNATTNEKDRLSALFFVQIARLLDSARPPIYKSKKKLDEVMEIYTRFLRASRVWKSGGKSPDPNEVIGDEIWKLSSEKPWWWRWWWTRWSASWANMAKYNFDMGKTPKPDLDEVFTLYEEDPEEVATTLVESDADEKIDRAEAEGPSE